MYGQFSPCVIFGVKEKDSSSVISENFLEQCGMIRRPDEVIRNHACTFVYGICVCLNDVRRNKKFKAVRKFLQSLKEDYSIDLGKPEYHLCIEGDYELCHKEYTPSASPARTKEMALYESAVAYYCELSKVLQEKPRSPEYIRQLYGGLRSQVHNDDLLHDLNLLTNSILKRKRIVPPCPPELKAMMDAVPPDPDNE